MMVVDRPAGRFHHARVRDLPGYLCAGDVLVVNDSRVIPARVFGVKKTTGGRVELLLLAESEPGVWTALSRGSRRLRTGTDLALAGGKIEATVLGRHANGTVSLTLRSDRSVLDVLEEEGVPPLPPYIRRNYSRAGPDRVRADGPLPPREALARQTALDRERYQTVYAARPGSIAAPTAGLHFTPELLAELEAGGVSRSAVTLHVGLGTFRPVTAVRVEEHVMEPERYTLGTETAERLNAVIRARAEPRPPGRSAPRIVAVGTTTVRVLETVGAESGRLSPSAGSTSLFIYPPFRFRIVDALLTNFHLPGSTLIMLVSAFAGRELILRAYQEAVREQYRFYSYGDCMLVL